MRGLIAASLATSLAFAVPAAAQVAEPNCAVGVCQIRVTPEQLLAKTETLVRARRFAEAAPLIAALSQAPNMKLQSRFLAGYSASEQGDYKHAADIFKAILSDDPNQTRVRLELARAMLFMGQTAGADRQFAIAQRDGELPRDIATIIRGARTVIRSQRLWHVDMDFGIAPDSNINNATSVDRLTIQLGDLTLPVELNDNAKAVSGTGQTGTLNAGVRLPFGGNKAMLVDFYGAGTNYEGARFDDYLVQAAAGPQLNLSDKASISAQVVGAQRWYGGRSASHQIGAKLGGQLLVSDNTRLGLQFDGRQTSALFDSNFSGWQLGLTGSIEQAISRSFVASASVFTRRDALKIGAYSNVEVGAALGIGGELPLGINVGLNASASRAVYDAPMPIFSIDPRKDWRLGAVATVGNRKLRFMGFSPSVQLSWSQTQSTLPFFSNDRLRLRFAVARYF